MNPFDLTGPQFLLVYLVFSALVITVVVFLRRSAESPATPKIDLSDPYLIAYLRGGEPETLRVATVSLIDRKLLVATGTELKCAENVSPASVRRPIEKELLRKFKSANEAGLIYEDAGLLATCKPYEQTLRTTGLLPSKWMERARMTRVGVAVVILAGIAFAKIFIALSRGHTNIWFLVILMAAAIFFLIKVSFPRLTETGKAMIADLQDLYSGLKDRALFLKPGGATIEPMLLASVFGVGALEGANFAFTRVLFPRATKRESGSCGASCGSACGNSCGSSCGSSCGGGCGGGCGGCGG
jgi:uncharacterized protein (TIGR04222 family)